MSCKTKKCGCEDKGLTTPTPCIHDTFECPNPDPCPETFSTGCVIYTRDSIVDTGFNQGDTMSALLQKISLWLTNPLCMDPNALCKSALNLYSIQTSPSTIKVGWSPNGTPVNYQVEYKLATSPTWILNPLIANTVFTDTIGGLVADSAYHIRVNSICGASNCYSVTILVKTKPTS
jgi:hypothetical protein